MDNLILNEKSILLLSELALISCLIIIMGSVIFGRILHQEIKRAIIDELHYLKDTDKMLDVIKEFLERTNEFWIIYGQIALAIFIVSVLFVLLLTKAISSEAGLPILSATTGFAIAKGSSISRSSSSSLPGPRTPPKHQGENNRGNDETAEKEHRIVDHGKFVDIDGTKLYKRGEEENS